MSMTTPSPAFSRSLGALQGLVLGDALGMPTQSMSAEWIKQAYGTIGGLRDAIADQPIAPNMPAGSVTDDTEQALIVARLIINGKGHIDALALAHELLDWEDDMRARGSHDLLGPSTKLALEHIRNGADGRTTGRTGTTNGAAMRVTPVGIANPSSDVRRLAERVHESCKVTHNTVHGFTSAALVAAAVSFGIDGANTRDALEEAVQCITRMRDFIADFDCAWSAKADVVARTEVALNAASHATDTEFEHFLHNVCGTSVESNESIPAAFALAWRFADEPFVALCEAVSLGGDTDTIAAMCGAILGASGAANAFPEHVIATITQVSRLNLEPLAQQLCALRG